MKHHNVAFAALTLTLSLSACFNDSSPSHSVLLDDQDPNPMDRSSHYWSPARELDATGMTAKDVKPFTPNYPLWSDGLIKKRWIALPAGSQIDSSDMNAWKFPRGTKLWKEFSRQDEATGQLVKVETRLIEKAADGRWLYASYLWSADQSQLLPSQGATDVAALNVPAGTPPVMHDVPNFGQCTLCHMKGSDPVLGFSALQLSQDEMAKLVAQGQLSHPPTEPVQIQGSTSLETRVIGYLVANCSSCHNPRGSVAMFPLNLSYLVGTPAGQAPVLQAINQFSMAIGPTIPDVHGRYQNIVPGVPNASMLMHRMKLRNDPDQMPKYGSKIVDTDGIALISEWITSLSP